MVCLPPEIIKVSFDGITIYMPVHGWSNYDKVPCLGAPAVDANPQRNVM